MTPLLHPQLVSGPFGDPALYVEVQFAKRALLFDLGDLHGLPPRKILKLTDIFVSHAHVDHFIGFDQVLRTFLGRGATLRLFGPAGFIDRVEAKLAGYSWNLVDRFETDLVFEATEVGSGGAARVASFRLRAGFRREGERAMRLRDGILRDEENFRVRAAVLDHKIPCLAFAVEERAHVNIWDNRLAELGLAVGPWLRELKAAVVRGDPDDTAVPVHGRDGADTPARTFPLGELKRRILNVVPGQRIAYVVDALFSPGNAERIAALAADADILFIEAMFAQDEVERAADRCHLTTAQAGTLGRLARAKRLEPFHFSPRYEGEEARLRAEVEAAFRSEATSEAARSGVMVRT